MFSPKFFCAIVCRTILIFTFLLSLYTTLSAQSLDSLITLQHKADPQEKIYIQTNKSYYSPGETIWFKAYLFSGNDRSVASKNFYAELRDEKGSLLEKKTAPVIVSGAYSFFDLPAEMPSSRVYLRAYTSSMLNGDTNFIQAKPLQIISANTIKNIQAPKVEPQLSFLPEGGNWVAGIANKMAFKATDGYGNEIDIKGAILINENDTVARFSTQHNGMGTISLLPVSDKNYTAVWNVDGKAFKTALPAVMPDGVGLHVSNNNIETRFSVQIRPDAAPNFKQLKIVGILNKEMVYDANILLSDKKTSAGAIIPTQQLGSGILQITVFDANDHPLAERITFINNDNYTFDANIKLTKQNTAKRSQNEAEITLADTLLSNLSISITDADLDMPETYADNIISHMLLTGDLRGKVANPACYFANTNDTTIANLDLVMLTHGWRRYKWDNLFAIKFPAIKYKESDYLSLGGQILGVQEGSISPGLSLTGVLYVGDSSSGLLNLSVNPDGKVLQDGVVFYDTAKMVLQFNDKKRRFTSDIFEADNGLMKENNRFGLTSVLKQWPYNPGPAAMTIIDKNGTIQQRITAKQIKDAGELQNVNVFARKKSDLIKMDKKYTSGMFAGGDAISFNVADDPFGASSGTIMQYLQGKVAGLTVDRGGFKWRGGAPSLFLNEFPTNLDMLTGTSMSDVAFIKIFRPGTNAASSGGSGTISVYLKKGGSNNFVNNTLVAGIKINGYSAIKEFYAPDYASESAEHFYENLRPTLYWQPTIFLDRKDKTYKFKFYNNDIATHFRIVLEGINDQGKMVYVEKIVGN